MRNKIVHFFFEFSQVKFFIDKLCFLHRKNISFERLFFYLYLSLMNNNIVIFLLIFKLEQSVHCTNNDFFSLLYSSMCIQSFYVVIIIKFFFSRIYAIEYSYLECLLLSCFLKIFIDDALLNNRYKTISFSRNEFID